MSVRWGTVERATATTAWVVLRGQAKPRRCEIWHPVDKAPAATGSGGAPAHTHPITPTPLEAGDEVLVTEVDWPPGRLAVIATR